MSRVLRLLTLAALFQLAGAGIAAAQTVLLKGGTPGHGIELVLDGTKVADGTVGPNGEGTVVGQIPMNQSNRAEIDGRVHIDSCGSVYRVHLVDKNRQPPAREQDCQRREVNAVFWIQQRSTLVIDVSGAIPTVLLRQGEYDPAAVTRGRRPSPRGLVLWAGGGWGSIDDVVATACGNVGGCEGKASGGAYAAGATVWLTRWLAVDGMYIKPRKASFEGGGSNFEFDHFLDVEIFGVGGKLAGPFGPVRLYGHGGGAFHRAISSTTQTNEPLQFTDDEGVEHTVPGGTQTLAAETEGWSWYAGGGLEGWVSPRVALFGEATLVKIKGDPKSGTDVPIDTLFTGIIGGLKIRIF